MKVFVSIDMEGITGVCVEEQTDRGHPAYGRAAALMRADLDATLRGCFDAGADEVVVRDAHDYSTNVGVESLPANVALIGGRAGPLGMMEGIDGTYDAALCVGYHARAGTRAAVLDHTFWGILTHAFVGDLELGELGFNAGVAGHFGVPVAFASGDDKLAREAAACVPGITTVTTKEGVAQEQRPPPAPRGHGRADPRRRASRPVVAYAGADRLAGADGPPGLRQHAPLRRRRPVLRRAAPRWLRGRDRGPRLHHRLPRLHGRPRPRRSRVMRAGDGAFRRVCGGVAPAGRFVLLAARSMPHDGAAVCAVSLTLPSRASYIPDDPARRPIAATRHSAPDDRAGGAATERRGDDERRSRHG